MWHFDRWGHYNVKSGYHITRSLVGNPSSLNDYGWQNWWKKVWGAIIPAKVKHFIWRTFHNFLPTFCSLRRGKLDVSPYCPVCGSKGESIEHILFVCQRAQSVWKIILLG